MLNYSHYFSFYFLNFGKKENQKLSTFPTIAWYKNHIPPLTVDFIQNQFEIGRSYES